MDGYHRDRVNGYRGEKVDEYVFSKNSQDWRSSASPRQFCYENQRSGSSELQSVNRQKPKFIGRLFPVDGQNVSESPDFQKPCIEKKNSLKEVNVDRMDQNTRQRNTYGVGVLQSTPRRSNCKVILDSSLSTINPNTDSSSDEEVTLI
jgi:hypothetical protein